MTSRCGNASLSMWTQHRTKRKCILVKIVRQDGFTLRFTDHDHAVTFENELYLPATFAGVSADRREAGMRSGSQEAVGIIDGTHITIPDLLGNLYRGAEVRQVETDWKYPWLWVAKHRRTVRTVDWTGSSWTATLENRMQVFQRTYGGRFGGAHTIRCPYVLGSEHCRAVFDSFAGPRVQTIVRQRWEVTMLLSTWPNPGPDELYRDGKITWLWSAPIHESQMTAISTATTITDSTQAWTPNQFVGKWVRIMQMVPDGEVRAYAKITSNSPTQIFYASDGSMAGFIIGTYFDVCGDAANAGVVSPIIEYRHATRRIKLLLPTPKDIAIGDSGTASPGCNGLWQTCKDKFNNEENFGGNHLMADAARILSIPEEQ